MVSPDSRSSAPQAPDDLGLVRSFVNTLEWFGTERGVEELDSPRALSAWLRDHGFAVEDEPSPEDLASALEFREAVRALLLANNGAELAGEAIAVLRAAAEDGPIRVYLDDAGGAREGPLGSGIAALFAAVLAAIARAQAIGSWERLKACAADDCQWAFYDTSRNRSRTWCSMEVCGNRAKTRAYRARRSDG
jgi:predicted RNA-binding Zn ribbon-like protein